MRTKQCRSLALFVLCLIPAPALAQRYKVTDLRQLSPISINSWAQVVGNYNGQAYIWTKWDGMHGLGTLSGGTFSRAAAINDLGVVAGTADGQGTVTDPTNPSLNQNCSDLTQPFIWTQQYGMRGLGSVVGKGEGIYDPGICFLSFYGAGINARGQVIGYTPEYGVWYQFGFLWTSVGGMSEFGGSWPPTFANDISNTGEIVGQNGDIHTAFIGHATSWKNGVATDLGTLGAGADSFGSAANGVNDLGFVVGWATVGPIPPFPIEPTASASPVHAILWTPSGRMSDLGTLPGDASSVALKINIFGLVIGSSGNTDCCEYGNSPFEVTGRPFIWSERTGMRDLNTLIPQNSGWVLNSVTDINIWGQIVGSGTRNGQPHGYLLTPINPFQVF
jgi:probable HAF family extracellular repeat protein